MNIMGQMKHDENVTSEWGYGNRQSTFLDISAIYGNNDAWFGSYQCNNPHTAPIVTVLGLSKLLRESGAHPLFPQSNSLCMMLKYKLEQNELVFML